MSDQKGYWEYHVECINDKKGMIDAKDLNHRLNQLGREGWHLVTAYTNEMGKNGLSLAGIGLNSTVDQNIFVFERYFDLVAEDNRIREIELKEKNRIVELDLERERKKKDEHQKLQEEIKTFDDLLNNPIIREEAAFRKKMCGVDSYREYLKEKAQEFNVEYKLTVL